MGHNLSYRHYDPELRAAQLRTAKSDPQRVEAMRQDLGRSEMTITFSQTLGTALGDWAASGGLGYLGGALVFSAALLVLAGLDFWKQLSRVFLFWAAFILTRPLGATVGDFFDKPLDKGGLDISRPLASLVLAAAIGALILLLPQRPGQHPGAEPAA